MLGEKSSKQDFSFFFQLKKFRKLKAQYGGAPGLMCDNIRPVQPLHKRKVYSVLSSRDWKDNNLVLQITTHPYKGSTINRTRNENVALTLHIITVLIRKCPNTAPHAATQTISVLQLSQEARNFEPGCSTHASKTNIVAHEQVSENFLPLNLSLRPWNFSRSGESLNEFLT